MSIPTRQFLADDREAETASPVVLPDLGEGAPDIWRFCRTAPDICKAPAGDDDQRCLACLAIRQNGLLLTVPLRWRLAGEASVFGQTLQNRA